MIQSTSAARIICQEGNQSLRLALIKSLRAPIGGNEAQQYLSVIELKALLAETMRRCSLVDFITRQSN